MGLSVIIYNMGIGLYRLGVGVAALAGNKKARKWIEGRKPVWAQLGSLGATGAVWVHAASLGEFEQGRPVLEAIREQYPGRKIVLTFFSPSGYEVRKNYPGADLICYLPLDTAANARRFVETLRPSVAIFIKYEFWYHYIKALNVPLLLISGIFRPDQLFFRWHGGLYRELLRDMVHIFLQNQESVDLLKGIGIQHVSLSGDTRFDRVWELRQHPAHLPVIARFCGDNKRVLVAGSTWEADEALLAGWWTTQSGTGRQLIIAPHEIGESHINKIRQQFPSAMLYSELAADENAPRPDVLIINNVGMLSAMYRYGDIAYVGGGFGKDGIHNLLEPAAYSKPVIIGPVYEKYYEAVQLVSLGGAISIDGLKGFSDAMAALEEPHIYLNKASIAGDFIRDNRGPRGRSWNILRRRHSFKINNINLKENSHVEQHPHGTNYARLRYIR
ncbi:3-deoxy-D-manno-octulosonic acid transferase [Chitinophaga sedimenti]|uniref:3-deoxy-D-manno-octulosonic acid transferase n=1 Tax=Chitinophaga sedimenti TaxID=2033606 RepID=UPI002005BC24|nr:glycosyltransferase N-terminal domain-containing protein [Chitinophaga sedimenti]MCK7559753.1 3-deoxy-D-manno-octulosonic acid transferase [Chitinophaga sedimenti]